MKIIIDSYIPYIKGVLDDFADVEYISYKQITPSVIADADALVIRTRTQCNASLLAGSNVRFIASATIGYDHIDAQYCKENGITWTNAPGCNARSVAQYIASALSFLVQRKNLDLTKITIGIVGVGAVGGKIAELSKSFGMTVLLNDPPRARKEGMDNFVSLKEICEKADIISFHTLLNTTGEDRTMHLADETFFNNLERKPIIINAARGEIIKTEALLRAIEKSQVSDVILDCWENEPNINLELLEKSTLATPHIAGYSAEGKANAATQSIQSVSRFFDLDLNYWEANEIPEAMEINFISDFYQFFIETYDIEADSLRLKLSPDTFEKQRSHYPFRREPKAYLKQMKEDFKKDFLVKFDVFVN